MMAICRMCGRLTEDGETICEDCSYVEKLFDYDLENELNGKYKGMRYYER